jgi:putative N-acetyltransferase (TIGR04045 family)
MHGHPGTDRHPGAAGRRAPASRGTATALRASDGAGAPAVARPARPGDVDILSLLGAPPRPTPAPPAFLVVAATADEPAGRRRRAAYARLRRDEFAGRQGLFAGSDRDARDDDPATIVLVAVATDADEESVLGGVRLHPEGGDPGLGWWRGSRLVVDEAAGRLRGSVGAALVRAACARALDAGALRFDAHVQARHVAFFGRLGWQRIRPITVAGGPHELLRWPIDRIARLAAATKQPLGGLLGAMLPSDRWRGDDGYPLDAVRAAGGGSTGVVACLDAIVPSMVQQDPEWAGWCGMLVTAHDLAAMGARPLAALDALGARDAAHAARVLDGLRAGAAALDLPLVGGHTQLGVPAALSVTGTGIAARPIAASGGRAGDALTVTADLAGGWRPGYHGRQWDSSSHRSREELRAMLDAIAVAGPRAAKDVSMAGIVGTTGMLAEASGTGATLDVAAIPRPTAATGGDWLTCFPGFAVVTADAPGAAPLPAGPAVGAACGRLDAAPGVRLRWPDGDLTDALTGGVTGLDHATDR